MRLVILLFLGMAAGFVGCKKKKPDSERPDWDKIKSATRPVVIDTGYGTPYRLDISTLGWEDGPFISPDGRTLYCFYTPLDLFSFVLNSNGDPFAIEPYLRGPFVEIVRKVPARYQGSASYFLSSDILISHRASVNDPFPPWSIAHFSTPATFDGAPQMVLNDTNPDEAEFLLFTYLNPDPDSGNEKNDIVYYRHTSLNPDGPFQRFPAPVNEVDYQEDNPHLEIIGKDSLVLFFTNDERPGSGGIDIFFSLSNDNGRTWTSPEGVDFNSAGDEDMPFLWRDAQGAYWMYYMTPDNQIARRKQRTRGDWKHWDDAVVVLDKGNALAVGEPTLTQWGDIVFALIYDAGKAYTTDRYDNDVWVLPRKGSPFDR